MIRLLLFRLVGAVATLLAVSAIVFGATEVLPGDVAAAVLGRDATPASLALIRKNLHLNDPAYERYGKWLWHMVQGDPGISLAASSFILTDNRESSIKGVPVTSVIGDRLKNTAILTLATTLVMIPLSIFFGVLSAIRRDRLSDRTISSVTLVLISVPEFVTATLLVLLFSLVWPVLPAVSLLDPSRSILAQTNVLVLPVLALLTAILAQTIRMVRASVLQVLQSEYVQAARLKGIQERRVLLRYVLPNALGPTIQVFAVNVAWLVGGVIIVETVFQFPGLGALLVDAVSKRDIPTVQAISLLIAVSYIAINLLADFVTLLLNPKLRTSL
jgi:peptide/nickel transport system permease protein